MFHNRIVLNLMVLNSVTLRNEFKQNNDVRKWINDMLRK